MILTSITTKPRSNKSPFPYLNFSNKYLIRTFLLDRSRRELGYLCLNRSTRTKVSFGRVCDSRLPRSTLVSHALHSTQKRTGNNNHLSFRPCQQASVTVEYLARSDRAQRDANQMHDDDIACRGQEW